MGWRIQRSVQRGEFRCFPLEAKWAVLVISVMQHRICLACHEFGKRKLRTTCRTLTESCHSGSVMLQLPGILDRGAE